MEINLVIDASNIRDGGGLTHLEELIRSFDGEKHNKLKITIFGGSNLAALPNNNYVKKKSLQILNKSLIFRLIWQQLLFPFIIKREKFNFLLSPGGIIPIFSSVPCVVISQNILPFDNQSMRYYGIFSKKFLKFWLIRYAQIISFKKSYGIIFLSEFAKKTILKICGKIKADVQVIPHGINKRFFLEPRYQRKIKTYNPSNPFKLLYVSAIDTYKHQLDLISAVSRLINNENLPIKLYFAGGSRNKKYFDEFVKTIDKLDPNKLIFTYLGNLPYLNLHKLYHESDSFIFASSCENLPNIVLEAMASGLPIASSTYGPLPEILNSNAIFFDPSDTSSIYSALKKIVTDENRRAEISQECFKSSKKYSWDTCSKQTFNFIIETFNNGI